MRAGFKLYAVGICSVFALGLNTSYAQATARPLSSAAARSNIAGPRTVLPLHNGHNSVDLLGNGTAGEIIVSRRENFNAHGFSLILFQVRAPTTPGSHAGDERWQVVPFFGGPEASPSGNDVATTHEGADCILRDLRVLPGKGAIRTDVVIATREFGA
jgi:hypothetical protein